MNPVTSENMGKGDAMSHFGKFLSAIKNCSTKEDNIMHVFYLLWISCTSNLTKKIENPR